MGGAVREIPSKGEFNETSVWGIIRSRPHDNALGDMSTTMR